jgi:hypothetical protein
VKPGTPVIRKASPSVRIGGVTGVPMELRAALGVYDVAEPWRPTTSPVVFRTAGFVARDIGLFVKRLRLPTTCCASRPARAESNNNVGSALA